MSLTTKQESKIITMSAQNMSTRVIGKEIGVAHGTVAVHRRKLRDQIARETELLLNEGLTSAREGTVRASKEVITQYNKKDKSKEYDKDLIHIGMQANKLILSAAGFIGNPSTIINQIIQVNNSNAIPPAVYEVLKHIANNDTQQVNLLEDVVDI